MKFWLELFPFFHHAIPLAWHRVTGFKWFQKHIWFEFPFFARRQPNKFKWCSLPFKCDPTLHHVTKRDHQRRWANDSPNPHPLKIALAEVIRKAADMIHVTMGNCSDTSCKSPSGTTPHVKIKPKLRNLNHRVFTGHRFPLDTVGGFINKSGPRTTRRRLWQHLESPSSRRQPRRAQGINAKAYPNQAFRSTD